MSALREYIDTIPVFSTHEHHRPFGEVTCLTLDALFGQSLIAPFTGVDCSDRGTFLDTYQAKSSFIWLEKAINGIFRTSSITEGNWDRISNTMVETTTDQAFHERIFREECSFSKVLLDAYWDSGSDNGRPDLYSGAFRIDSFLCSCNREFRDSAGTNTNAQVEYGECADIDEYLAMIDRVLGEKKLSGCRALKSGCAHIRSLDYQPRKKSDAARIFGRSASDVGRDDLQLFGDFIYDSICELAAQHGLPFQNHVGLSIRLPGSRAMNLIPMIERHRQTTFVFLHGGFPWLDESAALAHNYPNVYIDLAWLPMVSTSAAERFLATLIDIGATNRITWGGDTWTVIDSYAGLLAMRHILENVLSARITSSYLTEERAKQVINKVSHENAERLYGR